MQEAHTMSSLLWIRCFAGFALFGHDRWANEHFKCSLTLAVHRFSDIRIHIVGPPFWSRLITEVSPHASECDGIGTDNDVNKCSGNWCWFCFHFQRGAALAELIADLIQFTENHLEFHSSTFCLLRWNTGGRIIPHKEHVCRLKLYLTIKHFIKL